MPNSQSGNKATDAVLASHEQAWGVLLEAIRNPCLIADAKGAVLLANQPAQEGLALAPGAQLGEAFPDILGRIQHLLRGRTDPENVLLRHRETTYLTKVSLIRVGDLLLGGCCAFIPVAKSTPVADAAPAKGDPVPREEKVINCLPDGLWICDNKANVLRVNPISERLNMVKSEQVVGRNLQELIKEGYFSRSAALEVLKQKVPVAMLDELHGHKVILMGIPEFDAAGEIARVVVTEREVGEILALNETLEAQEMSRDDGPDKLIETVGSRRVIAKSPCMQKALRTAIRVASVDSTVLLLGESGVGKELFADIIYNYSQRNTKPFVKINCGAIPDSLIEAELFGYERGAFTSAHEKGKPGIFEVADGGIILLDEIGELTLAAQVKLLRFLEDSRVTRLGGTRSKMLNVRLLAGTHQDLRAMVERGAFRLDLFYRLNVVPIQIPPLRQRADCILPLLNYYLNYQAKRIGVRRRFAADALGALRSYQWPGNVRELANLCERLAVMTESELIRLSDLPPEVLGQAAPSPAAWPLGKGLTLNQILEQTERAVLAEAKRRYGSQTLMGKAQGVNQSTIAKKMKKYSQG
jgi:transcriptional regulator with PAS, ATPase and Fis domain